MSQESNQGIQSGIRSVELAIMPGSEDPDRVEASVVITTQDNIAIPKRIVGMKRYPELNTAAAFLGQNEDICEGELLDLGKGHYLRVHVGKPVSVIWGPKVVPQDHIKNPPVYGVMGAIYANKKALGMLQAHNGGRADQLKGQKDFNEFQLSDFQPIVTN